MGSVESKHKSDTGDRSSDEASAFICAQCKEDKNVEVNAEGFCENCKDLLCSKCIELHETLRATKQHLIVRFHCAQCMESKHIKQSSGFCNGCQDYLCDQCIQDHRKYRATKNHSILVGHNMPIHSNQTLLNLGKESTQNDASNDQHKQTSVTTANVSASYANGNKSRNSTRKTIFNVQFPTEESSPCVRSTVVLSTGEIVMSDDANNSVKAFDKQFNQLALMKMKNNPWDMCLLSSNNRQVCITIPDEKSVYYISVGTRLQKTKQVYVNGFCYGISCWKSGIAVTVFENEVWQMHLMELDGRLIRQIKLAQTICDPVFLASNKEGKRILISDWFTNKPSSVIAFDAESEKMTIIHVDEITKRPRSLSSDSKGNAYVAGNTNVYMLPATGGEKCVVLSEQYGLKMPDGICFNEKENAIILQSNRNSSEACMYRLVDK